MNTKIIQLLTEAKNQLLPLVNEYGAKIEINMEINSLIKFVKTLPEKQYATNK